MNQLNQDLYTLLQRMALALDAGMGMNATITDQVEAFFDTWEINGIAKRQVGSSEPQVQTPGPVPKPPAAPKPPA